MKINIIVFTFISVYSIAATAQSELVQTPINIDLDFCKETMSDEKFKKLIERSRYCNKDSDCTSFFTGNVNSPFSCETMALRKDKVDNVFTALCQNECLHLGGCTLGGRCKESPKRVICLKKRCEFKG
jgi:hypothetical protein